MNDSSSTQSQVNPRKSKIYNDFFRKCILMEQRSQNYNASALMEKEFSNYIPSKEFRNQFKLVFDNDLSIAIETYIKELGHISFDHKQCLIQALNRLLEEKLITNSFASTQTEELMATKATSILSQKHIQKFDDQINTFFQSQRSQLAVDRIKQIYKEVEIIREVIRLMNIPQLLDIEDRIEVEEYGSAVNNLWDTTSDIDVSINLFIYVDERKFLELVHAFLNNYIHQNLYQFKEEFDIELVTRAKVPLVRYNRKRKMQPSLPSSENIEIQIDISVNNILGCVNSRMLKTLTEISDKLPRLALAIKAWAKAKKLISKKTLSSYAFVLMMFNFLFEKKYLDSYFQDKMARKQASTDPSLPQSKRGTEAYYKENQAAASLSIRRVENFLLYVKRIKDTEEVFSTSIFFVDKVDLLQYKLNEHEATNPNKTVVSMTVAQLFTEFIMYYKNSTAEQRIIKLYQPVDSIDPRPELYFNIVDPFDKKHNPGERSDIKDPENNIYIKQFTEALEFIHQGKFAELFKPE